MSDDRQNGIEVTMTKERWPNFFIVGAPKAGTTSLYYYLKQTPGVFMPSVKEPNYFSRKIVAASTFEVIKDKHEYLGLFRNSTGYIAVGEASVSYLWDPWAPELIKQQIPDARIIILLRDPIERAFSDYLMRMKYGGLHVPFYSELLRDYHSNEKLFGASALYVELGMYHEQVKRYFEHFGRDRVMVIIFEEFIKHKEETLKNILSFLGISGALPRMDEQYNKYSMARSCISLWIFALFRYLRSKGIPFYKILGLLPESLTESLVEKYLFKTVTKPAIEQDALDFLRDKFSEDVAKLRILLKRDLPWKTVAPDTRR